MNAKHTPGPWAYHKWMASGTNYGIETADHRHGLAAITPNGNASTLISLSEHEANARLIAAAPELLAACQRALPWIGKMIADGAHMNSVLPRDCECAMEQLTDAIAKATGGDHA